MAHSKHWQALDKAIRVAHGKAPALSDGLALGRTLLKDKAQAEKTLAEDAAAIDALQDRLFAENRRALLVVLQGMDTSGKDGTIRSVFHLTSPLGVSVASFGKPSDEELAHDYLWRIHRAVPRRGVIGIFNRSHYEDVLVVKVHGLADAKAIEQRYEQINRFERHLTENGVTILKFMLHISKEEQAVRLRERLADPAKQWKFNPGDLGERKRWPDYMAAYREALSRCSTPHAPWRLVPSDKKWRRNAIIARIVRGTLEEMRPTPRHPGYDPGAFTIE